MKAAQKSPAEVGRKRPEMSPSIGKGAAEIDTRLVAAVQRRAGARVHEAAGLLNEYYLWAKLLARAEQRSDQSLAEQACPQVSASRARLRRFLIEPCFGYR